MNLNNALTALLLLACIGLSDAHADIVEGRDYTVLSSPQPTSNSKEIEILNFFWYSCPYCDQLHPYLNAWLKDKPNDVSFRDVPAILHSSWIPAAKTFFAVKLFDPTGKLHDQAFDAIHREKINLNEESVLLNWVEMQGVEREKFVNTYQSVAVQKQVTRAIHMTRQYQLAGVPALVVDGKYLTNTEMGKTLEGTVIILDKLIEKVRQEKETQ